MRFLLRKTYGFLLIAIALYFLMSCAQVGSLGGGPKDVTPPIPLEMIPQNYSNNFTGKKISIKFNEFVVLDKITEQLLVSPPIEEMPDFRLKGKELVIKFNEDLRDNTTYTLFFGDAIKDLTEGNPLHNFTYVFSTGDYVDSLSMTGNLVTAFDLLPVEKAAIMLYKNNNDTIPFDSLPLRIPPYYLSRTDEKGNFFLTGLAGDYYLVFALNDKNNNYIFDQPTEEIAFLDTLYYPVYIPPKTSLTDTLLSDTLSVDTISNDSVSLMADSLIINIPDSLQQIETKADSVSDTIVEDTIKPVRLFMFLQEDTVMRLLDAKLVRLNTMRFVFSLPADSVKIDVENKPADAVWFLQQWNKDRDTLTWFLHEPEITLDTFNLLFWYKGDTLDYIYLPVKPKEKKTFSGRKRDKEKETAVHNLGFNTNMKGNVKPERQFDIEFNQPVDSIGFDSVLFVKNEDSIWSPEFHFVDSLKRKIVFPYISEPGVNYSMTLPDSCVKDWNGYYNEAKKLSFQSKELKSYGTLTLNLKPESDSNYIIQLLNKKEKVLKQIYFKKDTTILFKYLTPGDYLLKIIFDKNNNGKWDTGNYIKGKEPESVTYYNKMLTVRANWEIEEVWEFKNDDKNPPPLKRKPFKN